MAISESSSISVDKLPSLSSHSVKTKCFQLKLHLKQVLPERKALIVDTDTSL